MSEPRILVISGPMGAGDEILNAAALEDFTMINDDRPVTDVARGLLARAGWM